MNTASTAPNKGKIVTICIAHLFNDWYMNYVQTMLPFLVAAGLSVSKGAFLVSAFTVTSSLLQPVSGYLVDKKNQRWMVYVGTLWMAVLLSLIGVLRSFPLLLVTVVLAGLGTAAFHPQASAMISSVSGDRRGLSQAIFSASGNVGWALTPLMVVPFVQAYGIESTLWFAIPGVLVAGLLWFNAPRNVSRATPLRRDAHPIPASVRLELSIVVLVVAFRSLAYFGLISFLPLYLQQRNISLLAGSRLLFVMLLSGAVGGLICGYVSDLIGRKIVIVISLLAASPLLYLFLHASGPASYILLALAGACLLASFSVTVVTAQEILSRNAATASGLMLGFSIGIGGLGVGLVGLVAEHSGITYVIHLLTWLPLVAGVLALGIKGRKIPKALYPGG